MVSIKSFIQENYSGGEKLTAKDSACIERLQGFLDYFNVQRKKADQMAGAVKAGQELWNKHRAEYDRLMSLGLLKAAQEAMEAVPQIIADIQAARRQLADLNGELKKTKDDFVKQTGLIELRSDYFEAASVLNRLREKLVFIEQAAEHCDRHAGGVLSTCEAIAAEAEKKIKIPLDPVK
jgi:hypothetical protein